MASPAKRRSGRPRNADKEARKANFLKKIFNGDQATKSSSLAKRKPTLMKKAMELETLCGIDVTIVCFDPDGKTVDIWPENESEVKKRFLFYKALKNTKEWNVSGVLQDKKRKIIKKKLKQKGNNKKNVDLVISDLSNWLNGLSGDQLRDLVTDLETKVKRFRDRIDFLVINQQQKQEEVSEKDWFSELTSNQTRPVDHYFDPVVEFDHNKINENQLIHAAEDNYGLNGINGLYGCYENPIRNDCYYGMNMVGATSGDFGIRNNYYYGTNMVGGSSRDTGVLYSPMIGAESSNSNCLIYSGESVDRTSSMYDVMPISQWPLNYGDPINGSEIYSDF
ncbi:AGAMOUS-like 26 [Euphorbia peplus]|nr:AGAMOUS-like 26 [Euphorbia peplus]